MKQLKRNSSGKTENKEVRIILGGNEPKKRINSIEYETVCQKIQEYEFVSVAECNSIRVQL